MFCIISQQKLAFRACVPLPIYLWSLWIVLSEFNLPTEKWTIPGLFVYFWYFQTNIRILQQINVTIIHLVSGAGNRTHNLLNMSLLPQPLDQCSPPSFLNLATKSFFYLLSILYIKYHQPKRMFYLYIVYSSLRLVYLHAFLGVLSITFKH